MSLPSSWREAAIDEICEVNPRERGPVDTSSTVSFVPMPAVSDTKGEIIGSETRAFSSVSKGYTRFRDGDVIFAKITPCMENGKIAVASGLHGGFACGSTEFHVLRPKEEVLAEYVRHFLRQETYRSLAAHHMTGAVGQRRVPVEFLKKTVLPLPPVSEQRCIVAKLDDLMAGSERARDELAHIPKLIDRYKRAVLAAAYVESETLATTITTLGAVAEEVRNGVSRKPENAPPGVPVLKISAVRSMIIRMDERRYYAPELGEDVSRYLLRTGDLLFTRYNGNPDLVANCGMVRALEGELIYPDKLIRVRVNRQIADPEFVEALSASPQARALLNPFIKSAAGQHGISGVDLKRLVIPLPPTDLQLKIVKRTKRYLSAINGLATESNRATSLLDRLDQGLLAKAFRGELAHLIHT